MSNTMQYSTVEQQIEHLKKQHLTIHDERLAEESLKLFGYSNLIKSYREPYTIISEGKKFFRDGVSFEQICSLYILDKNLRNAVMASMLDLEEHIKEAAADVIAVSFGIHEDHYLQYRNYQNKKKRKYQFTLPAILDTLKKTLNTDKNPIYHYKNVHNIVPPWILFKSVYFSTITNFIDLFKQKEQVSMVEHLYNTNLLDFSETEFVQLMMDTLFTCLEYRNVAAHGGRIYNYICTSNFRNTDLFGHPVKDFSQLLLMLSALKYKNPFNRLNNALQTEINRHCSSFPSDVTYLGKTLNMNISLTKIVFISERSRKYHSDMHCSGIHNAHQIELSEAQALGYEPCKRCCV